MSVNRSNYEAYFLDYWEKNLPPGQVADLLLFLQQNPDLMEEFESYDHLPLSTDESIVFKGKSQLKKRDFVKAGSIDESNFEEKMIANLEGDLNDEESAEFRNFLELNPQLKLDYHFFRKTFLKPEPIEFSYKHLLLKKGFFVVYRKHIQLTAAIAASVIIFLALYFSFNRQTEEQNVIVTIENEDVRPSIPDDRLPQTKLPDQIIQSKESLVILTTDQPVITQPGTNEVTRISGNFTMSTLESPQTISGYDGNFPFALSRNEVMIPFVTPEDESQQEKGRQKSFVARFVTGLTEKLIRIENPENKSLIDYTIDGYNLMADKNVMLEKERDESGNVIAYSLNGEEISILRRKARQND
jgi:hypothetical protein